MKRRRRAIAAVLAGFLGAGALPARGAEFGGEQFVETLRVGDTKLALVNGAQLRYRLVFHPYAGVLYLGEGVAPKQVFEDVPKRLELAYFYKFGGSDFGPAGVEVLAQNVPAETIEQLKPRLEKMNALYVDIVPGDRYAITYLPGKGTTLAKNGKALGTIEGADFASAYFKIWLGPKPISEDFRDALLTQR